jgi:hypothetical protein
MYIYIMQYNNINNLSMTGGDDFTDISQILDRCVLLDVNQTILSNKIFDSITDTRFDGDLELNGTTTNTATFDSTGTLNVGGTLNLTTDIVANKSTLNITNTGSTIINPQNICALQVAGNDKFVSDIMNTSIYATSALNLSAGGSTNTQMTSANFQNNFGTQQTYQVNNATKLLLANTATTLNNTTTNIQSGATNKITTNATITTLNNETTNIQSNGTNRITVNPTTTGLNNDTTNIQSSGTTKIQTTGSTTTLTNDTIDLTASTGIATNGTLTQTGNFTAKGTTITLQDATPTTHFTQSSTATNITNATINLESGGSTADKYRQTGTLTILDNDEIRMRYRTSNRLVQTATATTLTNTTINLQDETPTTRFSQNNGTTTITNTNIGTNGILTQTGSATLSGTTITLQDATPTTRFQQTNGTTTITNTNIDLTATGTSGEITLTGGGSSLNIGIDLDSVGTIRIDSDNDVRLQASDTIRIQAPAGSSRATFQSGTTTLSNTTSISLDHPTTTISSASASKMSITGTTSTFNNTGVVTLQSTGSAGQVSISANNNSTEGILLKQNGTGGVRVLSSTTSPLTMGTGTTNYATVSSAGVGATEYWVGSGGANSFPLSYPLLWLSTATTGQTTSQCRVGSFPDNNTAETFIRYRFPFRSRIRAMTLLSDGETINASQTYIHISATNTTGLDASPNYAYWIYDAGVGNPGDIVVTDNGSMTSVADIPANTTFYVFLAFGSLGATINSVGTARTVPAEFQVHLWIQQVV